jgi:ATP-dependent DNA helicase Rep
MTEAQRAAVEHDLGPMLVLAGAGSGKTRVVTHRIARLMERGVPAKSILAVTFTNKAAAEMLERVVKLVGPKAGKELMVSTFHRFGLTVLGAEVRSLGFRGGKFAIFDQADCTGVIRELLRETKTTRALDVGAILGRISVAKNTFLEPAEWLEAQRKGPGVDEYDEIAMVLYPKYRERLLSFQAFDFDDLICEVVRLFRRRPEILERYQMRFRYLIVDEYQDTNHAQLELVRLLGGAHRNVCVVGDDDQSIYAWRGADVRNILDFESHFPGAKVVKLEHNFRSSGAVLEVARRVLERAGAKRHPKTIVPTREPGLPVTQIVAADPDVEASYVGTEIQRLVEKEAIRPREIAILYRSNLQSQELELSLKERQIPFRVIGGTEFYERKEVKDLIAYLRVAMDPRDEMNLRRIINYPARGIGDVALAKLSAHATAYDKSLYAVVEKAHAVQDLPPAAVQGCRELVRVIEGTRARFERAEPSATVARAVVEEVGLKADIHAGATSNAAAARRLANLEGMLGVFGRRDDQGKGGREKFAEFLRIIALREEGEEQQRTDVVTLTTMHGAKGLEFRYVFLIGLEEGLLPHGRVLVERATDVSIPGQDNAVSLEEERRLFYVAVTRAKDQLWLCRTRVRNVRGKLVPRVVSRFVSEIPEELLVTKEVTAPAAPPPETARSGLAGLLAALPPPGAPPTRRP